MHCTESISIAAISGMAGLGKTELALQYALTQRYFYSGGVCWIQSRGVDVGTQLIDFFQSHLELPIPFDSLKKLDQQVAWCWRNWEMGGEPVLIVLDDVTDYEDIQPYLPPISESRFKVLLTTRYLEIGAPVRTFQLGLLSPDASIELLESLLEDKRLKTDLDKAKYLCEWLGYLPLGLELIGRYLRQRPDLSLEEMGERLENERLEQRALSKHTKGMTASLNLISAFELSWKALDESSKKLVCLISLFATYPFPWFLVEKCFSGEPAEDLENSRDEYLVNLSLVHRVGEEFYQIHQLTKEFLMAKLSSSDWEDDIKQRFCETMALVSVGIPEFISRELITIFSLIIPHVIEAVIEHKDWIRDEYLDIPFQGIERFYVSQGDLEQTILFANECLSLVQSRLGENHLKTASSLSNLAVFYVKANRYEEAKPPSERILKISKELGASDDRRIYTIKAIALDNLASIYASQQCFEKAKFMYEEALDTVDELSTFGAIEEGEHDILPGLKGMILDNFASLYRQEGKYEAAESLSQKALNLLIEDLGEDHPHVAICLDNIASLRIQQGKYEAAESLSQQALKLLRQNVGDEHPDALVCIKGIAQLHFSQNRFEEAEQLFRKALEIERNLYGEQYSDGFICLCNIARACFYQNRYAEAEQSYQEALTVSKKIFGAEHSNTLLCLEGLFSLYRVQGNFSEAKFYGQKVLELRKLIEGETHASVSCDLLNLALLYGSLQKHYEGGADK